MFSVFTDYTFQIVALGTGFLGLLSGVMGTFLILRGESLLGDTLGHSSFLGITLAFLLFRQMSLPFLLVGAAISGLLSAGIIDFMSKHSKVKFDSAMALNLSWFFGMGLVFLTYIQSQGMENSAGLSNFIFGQAGAMLQSDVVLIVATGILMLIVVGLFWKEFKVITFDPDFAQIALSNSTLLSNVLSFLIIVTIILGLQSVGVILISSLLIAPAVAARQLTDKLGVMVVLSAIFGSLSGIIGTLISTLMNNMPTGPAIVVIASIIALISLVFSPKRGLLKARYNKQLNRKRMLQQLEQAKGGE